MKKILAVLLSSILTTATLAENIISVYANDPGSYSIAFLTSKCVGNFDFNYTLSIPISQIASEACQDNTCNVILYTGDNCPADKVIATGKINVKSGKTKFINEVPNYYVLTGENFYIGVETKRPHC